MAPIMEESGGPGAASAAGAGGAGGGEDDQHGDATLARTGRYVLLTSFRLTRFMHRPA